MADDDANGRIFHLRPRSESPSVPLPPLPPDARPQLSAYRDVGPGDERDDEPSTQAGGWPSLPSVSDMRPPVAFSMPALPAVESAVDSNEEGAFVPPAPADPANPTVKDTLAVCMAIVTALGVAAVNGMWHRARHRSALADQARANADKAVIKAGKSSGRSGGATESKGSLLHSPKGSRPGGGRKRRGEGDHPGGHRKPPRGPHKTAPDTKAPKADRDGKNTWKDRDKSKRRRKLDKDKEPFKLRKRRRGAGGGKPPKGPDSKTVKDTPKAPKAPKRPGKLTWKAPKHRGKGSKDPKSWTSGRPKGTGKGTPKPKRPKLTWKAPKRRPGLGGSKTTAGRKRWTRGKVKPIPKLRKKSWTRRTGKAGARWFKRWVRGGPGATTPPPWPRTPTWKASRKSSRRRWSASSRASRVGTSGNTGAGTPPPPPPRFEWMRPPPGADRKAWTTVDSVTVHRRPRPPKAKPAVLAAGTLALPPAAATTPTPGPRASGAPETGQQPSPKTSSDVTTGVPVAIPAPRLASAAIPVHGAQFRDAELTIRDVLEAGEEMAEEILVGVDTAQRSAAMCETLAARLEALHAELCELEVPGILIPNVAVLLDKAQDVRGKALAIAEGLPLASEAMRVASANAAVRHGPTADMTRDMGHIKPAERPYHEE